MHSMAMFGAVFETAFVRGLDVAGDGEEVLQLDTTVTETPNEALTVAASTDVEAMLRASTTTEYLMRPSVQWTSAAPPSADTKTDSAIRKQHQLHRQFIAKLEASLGSL